MSREQKVNGKNINNRNVLVSVMSFLIITFLFSNICHADNAEVLPKGISGIGINGKFYSPIDVKFDPHGDAEDAAKEFNSTLDSNVFPALALVELGFGLPVGSANVGKSIVSFKYDFKIVELAYQYGLSDKLTLGLKIPYWWVKNDVKATLDSSGATVGKSVILNTLAPIGLPGAGTVPLTTEDTQNLIGDGLDINGDGAVEIQGYGYKPLETWSDNGLSDIEVGMRYQYFTSDDWRLAVTFGTRFPTGQIDDPDNLVDYGFGCGTWAFLFHFNQDYLGINHFVFNTTFRYFWVLPDKELLRVPHDINHPITSNKEEVDRDLGDIIELEASGQYQFTDSFSISLLYKYGFGLKDKISGSQGFSYQALEEETDYSEHVAVFSLDYSTLSLYRAKKFPIPLNLSLSYRDRFAGSNNAFKSKFFGVGIMVYF